MLRAHSLAIKADATEPEDIMELEHQSSNADQKAILKSRAGTGGGREEANIVDDDDDLGVGDLVKQVCGIF